MMTKAVMTATATTTAIVTVVKEMVMIVSRAKMTTKTNPTTSVATNDFGIENAERIAGPINVSCLATRKAQDKSR